MFFKLRPVYVLVFQYIKQVQDIYLTNKLLTQNRNPSVIAECPIIKL